jgi:hypothetical protein
MLPLQHKTTEIIKPALLIPKGRDKGLGVEIGSI